MDLIIAIILFITAFFIFYSYSSDLLVLKNDKLDIIIKDAELVSNHLVSGGFPLDWDSDPSSAIYVGLTGGNKKIVPDKVTAINTINYNTLREILGINSDFYAFFSYRGNPVNIDGSQGFGKPGVTKDNIMQVENPEDLIKVDRLLFYNSTIINLGVYVW